MTDTLQGPRLKLRRAHARDLQDLHAVMSQPRAMRYWSRPAHLSLDLTEAFLNSMLAPDHPSNDFVIELNGRVIGKAGAWRLPEIGFILHPDHWRQGYAREALGLVIPHLFARHDIDALTAEADPRNAASLGLLAGFGFRETHRAERTLKWGDEWCDSVYLALPRQDWLPA